MFTESVLEGALGTKFSDTLNAVSELKIFSKMLTLCSLNLSWRVLLGFLDKIYINTCSMFQICVCHLFQETDNISHSGERV